MGLYRQINIAKERVLVSSISYREIEVAIPVDNIIPYFGRGDTFYDDIVYARVDAIVIAYLTSVGSLYDPIYEVVLEYGAIPLLTSAGTLWDPAYNPVSELTVVLLTDAGVLYNPTITLTPNDLTVVFLESAGTLYSLSYSAASTFDSSTGRIWHEAKFLNRGMEVGEHTIITTDVLVGSGGIGDVLLIETAIAAWDIGETAGAYVETSVDLDFADTGVITLTALSPEITPIYVAHIIT